MDFNCTCTFAQKSVGDGCHICNTDKYIDLMFLQPEELLEELQTVLDHYQAEMIVREVFTPLAAVIATLSNKIDQLSAVVDNREGSND